MSTGPHFYALSSRTIGEMEEALAALQVQSRSRSAFVLDRTGCLLAACGDFHPLNPETMGAIAAGAVAALNSLVARAESPELSIRFYGADVERIHFALLSDRLILTLVHPRIAGSGGVRAATKAFIQKVRPMIDRDQTRPSTFQSLQFIENKLDQLFTDPKPKD